MIGLPLKVVSFITELILSRRGIRVIFFMVSLGLATAGWLRPPLSSDISSLHMPWGVWKTEVQPPEEILYGPRKVVPDGVGIVLSVLIAAGTMVMLLRPQLFVIVAGFLLCGSIAANAAMALNHPSVIESMDLEYEQHRQIVTVIMKSPQENVLANARNGRVGVMDPAEDEQRGDPGRGFMYLLYGRWLVLWAIVGVLFGSCGPLRIRLAYVAGWIFLGVVLSSMICLSRLHAEYIWFQAKRLEAQGDYRASRQALKRAVSLFPEFDQMERTWLLAGKLDCREARSTPQNQFFRANQLARDKEQPRAIVYEEDLPWLISETPDARSGLAAPHSGFDLVGNPPAAPYETGTPYYSKGLSILQGHVVQSYEFGRKKGPRQGIDLMEHLLEKEGSPRLPVRNQAARLLTDIGLDAYLHKPTFTNSGMNFPQQNRNLVSAQKWWQSAFQLVPQKRDCAYYLGLVTVRINRSRPDLAEAQFEPLLSGADRILRAEILATLGDAYLEAGQLSEARKRYAESSDAFTLPKRINYRAQKGLGGL